jgi:hypothetical protein
MKRLRWILSLALLLGLGVWLGWGCTAERRLRATVEATRQQLRQAGFKTELSEFNLTVGGEMRQRADAVRAAAEALQAARSATELQLMPVIGSNVALRTTREEFIPTENTRWQQAMVAEFQRRYGSNLPPPSGLPEDDGLLETTAAAEPEVVNLWTLVAEELQSSSREMEHVTDALAGGEFRFEPAQRNGNLLLPHLAGVKGLQQAFGARAALALREQRTAEAFTNLLTASRLVTHWIPEPAEVSHLVRFASASLVQRALWEGLQADDWDDAQLAALQREWEAARFFDGLPETVALSRASLVQECRAAREEEIDFGGGNWGAICRQIGGELLSSPANGFREAKGLFEAYQQHVRYRNVGSYEDEKGLLVYFRDRELELRRAMACTTWAEMRALPGVTNLTPFLGATPSRIQSRLNLQQMNYTFAGEGRRPLARAAETEALRRLIVTALALKRFQQQHGTYPETLAALCPALLAAVPVDFMDGQPLRYRRGEDGRFLLYSVGLDCVDNGGRMKTREQLREDRSRWRGERPFSPFQDRDLIWPMPANEEERAFHELTTNETLIEVNEVFIQELEQQYLTPRQLRTLEATSPYPPLFE